MAEIIEFGKKARDLKSLQHADLRKRKIESLRKIFQCTRCMMKCTKCGVQLQSEDHAEAPRYATPYHFCSGCRGEYEEYRRRLEGGDPSEVDFYWHNDAWMEVWRTWLEHQRTLDLYRQSKEFLQLLREVEDLMGE